MRERGRLKTRAAFRRIAIENIAQIEAEQRLQNRRAAVDRLRDNRMAMVKSPTHASILRALARKQKCQFRRGGGGHFTLAGTAELFDQAAPVLGRKGEPLAESAPASLQSERNIAEALFRMRFNMRREAVAGFRQGIALACRQDKQMCGAVIRPGRGGGRDHGRFLDD